MNEADFDHPPIVVGRRKSAERMFAVCGVIALIAAAVCATQARFRFTGLPLGVVGFIVLLVGIVQLVRPTRLILAPEGLQYSILGIDRHWAWHEVSRFHVVRVRSGKAIVFDVSRSNGSASFAFPGFFSLPAAALAALLQEARDRWAPGQAGPTASWPA